MERVVSLNDSIRTLRLPYLYEISVADLDKRKKHMQIGLACADILENVLDTLESAAYHKLVQMHETKTDSRI